MIGMIHFPPLIGYPDYPGFDYIANKMLKEATILEKAGFNAIMIENNYDIPHTEKIPAPAAAMFGSLARLLQENIKIPFGIDILWNDFETSLAICASTNSSFFRVPAFVDTVNTAYGLMNAKASKVTKLRHHLGLDHIVILADVQVKHSEMVDKNKSLTRSVQEAIRAGADGIIITGKWTGDAPKIDDLVEARKAAKNFPLIIGSGATKENLRTLLKYTYGVIVGTALKGGSVASKEKEINIKPFNNSVTFRKASEFIATSQKNNISDLLIHHPKSKKTSGIDKIRFDRGVVQW